VTGIVGAIGYAIDPYGVLRDPGGRKLPIYFSQRKAKFLMNKRYVPANFDGLLIGASESGNWDVPTLAGAKVYNESLHGVSATEERFVVSQALNKGRFKLAVILLTPTFTRGHDFKEGLDAVKTSEAIGSIHAIVNSAARILVQMHVRFNNSEDTPYGSDSYVETKGIHVRTLDPSYFQPDLIALEDFRSMAESLRDCGARIVYVVPPVYRPHYDLNKNGYKTYVRIMRQALPPGPVIDFNDPEYTNLTGNRDIFFDCYHTKRKGASAFTALLDKLVPQAIASRN
jgi:hypothetical protein